MEINSSIEEIHSYQELVQLNKKIQSTNKNLLEEIDLKFKKKLDGIENFSSLKNKFSNDNEIIEISKLVTQLKYYINSDEQITDKLHSIKIQNSRI